MNRILLIALLTFSFGNLQAQIKFIFSYKNDLEPIKVTRNLKADVEVKDSAIYQEKKLIGFIWERKEVVDGDSVTRYWFFYPNGKPLADIILKGAAPKICLMYTETDSMESDVVLKKVKPEKMKNFLVSYVLKKKYL
ncbi:MAG: hypothetical protein EXR21_02240 [Flavobacteriaceae bacterium]|nr:hypothetical protein [Flavobacteriaceae bacterium]